MEIYVMVTRVVCQTQKLLLMLQVVVGSSRGENAIAIHNFRYVLGSMVSL